MLVLDLETASNTVKPASTVASEVTVVEISLFNGLPWAIMFSMKTAIEQLTRIEVSPQD